MISRAEAERLVDQGGSARNRDGELFGRVVRVFLDEYTGWPSFMTVQLDETSAHETFVALHEAALVGGEVVVPYDGAQLHNAPTVSAGQELSLGEEDALFDYYGVPVEGVEPSVAHLGSALASGPDGVNEEPVHQPT